MSPNLFEENEAKPEFICNHCQLGWHSRCQAPGKCHCTEEVDDRAEQEMAAAIRAQMAAAKERRKIEGFTTTEAHLEARRTRPQ